MAKTRHEQPTLTGRVISFISRTHSTTEAREQIAATEAKIAKAKLQLDEALAGEERALLALADGMDEAAEARDAARQDARRLKDELRDLEIVLDRQSRRLADAQAAEKRAAEAATWQQADKIIADREQAGARADAALVELGEALRDLEHQTGLLAALMGPAVEHISLTTIRANLRGLLGEAIDGHKRPFSLKPLAELTADQHALVRANVRL
jgi:chromosome segregation ATPase